MTGQGATLPPSAVGYDRYRMWTARELGATVPYVMSVLVEGGETLTATERTAGPGPAGPTMP